MNESDDATRLAIELRVQLREARRVSTAPAEPAVRGTVARYAAALKTLGLTRQEAVAAMKAVAREAGLEPRSADDPLGDVDAWFVEAYG